MNPAVNGIKIEEGTCQQGETVANDDDDPVVHEIPVFLAKALADQLYLFQYPVRPAHMTYDTSTVVASKIRPQQQQVELSVALETRNPNYDTSKGEQIALNVDGSGNNTKGGRSSRGHAADGDDSDIEGRLFSSGIMDKQVLSSTRALKEWGGRYAVGILGGNELHVTPIKGVIQLRPDLKYLDKGDKTARAEGRADPDDPYDPSLGGGGGGGGGTDGEGQDDLKPVTVRFAKPDHEGAKRMRERSFEYQQKKSEEEAWIPTRFHNIKSAKWEEDSQNLFCKKMDEEVTMLNSSPEEYLKSLTKTT